MSLTSTSISLNKDAAKQPMHGLPACAHCGEEIGEEQIFLDDQAFCCEGCRMVYEILHTNYLSTYYQKGTRPGISRRGRHEQNYAWLDDADLASKIIDYQDEKIARLTFHLPQIHCTACLWLLENLYRLNEGVLQVKVNFLKKNAFITYDPQQISLRQLVELLALIGYAPELHLDRLDNERQPAAIDRAFQYKLGIAGFAFGNIMLLSFPEYLGLSDVGFQQIFGYLNILLALPVVFYNGKSYLQSAWHGLQHAQLNLNVPIAIGILTLFGRSTFEILTHTGAGYMDSLAGFVFFLLIGQWFQQKTYHRLSFERDYRSYFPIAATVKYEGIVRSVALDKLQIGDTVIVRHHELIPADGILLRGDARIDYSFVTGESEPVRRNSGDTLYAGGRLIADTVELSLTKRVSQSYLTQLWNDAAFSKPAVSANASRLADRVGKWFTACILLIATLTLLYWLPEDVGLAVNAFTAVLIIACPCAVALSIPFTLGNALRQLAGRGLYLKNTQVIEDLARIDTVVFDKTGTITDTQKSSLDYQGAPLSQPEKIAVCALVSRSTHPMSRRIETYLAETATVPLSEYTETAGLGIRGTIEGMEVEIRKHEDGTALLIDGKNKGVFKLHGSYRRGFEKVIDQWQHESKDLHLLSGDNDRERGHLSTVFLPDHLHFDRSPADKLRFIKNLQDAGKNVLMLGDGLNDAGALQQSQVGIVVADDTNNFTPACDAVLHSDYFAELPGFLAYAKSSVRMVYGAYGLAFIYNLIGLSFAVQGLLSPVVAAILMPLSSVAIVAFGVGSSNYQANKKLQRKVRNDNNHPLP